MRRIVSRPPQNRLEPGFRPKVEKLEDRLQPGSAMWNLLLGPMALAAPTAVALDSAATSWSSTSSGMSQGNWLTADPTSANVALTSAASTSNTATVQVASAANQPAPVSVNADPLATSLGNALTGALTDQGQTGPAPVLSAPSLSSLNTTGATVDDMGAITTASVNSVAVNAPIPTANTTGTAASFQAMAAASQQIAVQGQTGQQLLSTPVPDGTPLAVQMQVHLSIFIDSYQTTIPAGIGQTSAGNLPIYTQDTSGTIHVASPVAQEFHLGDFFNTWGKSFSSQGIFGHPVDGQHFLYMNVNGQANQDFDNLVLHDQDNIVIVYGQQRGDGGALLRDDTVEMGILPGTYLQVKTNKFNIGDMPPSSVLGNVQITDDGTGAGTLFISQSSINFRPYTLTYNIFGQNVDFNVQLQAQSDANGTYDRNTGAATAQVDMNVVVTSNASGFNNSGSCAVPTTHVSFSTANTGGSPFLNGNGTVVDNTYIVQAVPHGACGSFLGIDYADALNQNFGLPSLNPGDNILSLHLQMRPAIGPFTGQRDDTIGLGLLPGTYIKFNNAQGTLGTIRTPGITIHNVQISDDGTGAGSLFISKSNLVFPTVTESFLGISATFALQTLTDATGSYDRNTGIMTVGVQFDIKITSTILGFNNNSCIVPAFQLNLGTNDSNGQAFLNGQGKIADSKFAVDAIPNTACGSFLGIQYAGLINQFLGLPSGSGKNILILHLLMDPAIGPFAAPPPDNVVSFGLAQGSLIQIKSTKLQFGGRPHAPHFNNVTITDNGNGTGTIFVPQANLQFPSFSYTIDGVDLNVDVLVKSDLNGTYNYNTGQATASLMLSAHATSNAYNFDNTNCILPTVSLNASTDNTGGMPFMGGNGIIVDNTFIAQAIPAGACGHGVFLDYTQIINDFLGLPSLNPGDNILALHILVNPPLTP